MALYGQARDISMFRYVNRELMQNIISQQCVLYKYDIEETKVNIYGEAASQKYYHPPVLLYALIEIGGQGYQDSELGPDFNWNLTFKFLKDDLLAVSNDNPHGANVVPQVGDIIMYQKAYYEVDSTNISQFFVGKDPDYPNSVQPTGWNPGLENFGYNTSIICNTHYVPADKVGITKERT